MRTNILEAKEWPRLQYKLIQVYDYSESLTNGELVYDKLDCKIQSTLACCTLTGHVNPVKPHHGIFSA